MEYEQISDRVKMLWRENFELGDKKYTQVSGISLMIRMNYLLLEKKILGQFLGDILK